MSQSNIKGSSDPLILWVCIVQQRRASIGIKKFSWTLALEGTRLLELIELLNIPIAVVIPWRRSLKFHVNKPFLLWNSWAVLNWVWLLDVVSADAWDLLTPFLICLVKSRSWTFCAVVWLPVDAIESVEVRLEIVDSGRRVQHIILFLIQRCLPNRSSFQSKTPLGFYFEEFIL